MHTLLLIVVSAIAGAVGGELILGRRGGAQQCRRPSGKQGRAVLHRMNVSHAGVTQWGLSHVQIKPHFTILDVGCGGGQTIKTVSTKTPDGKVFGIDYSEESVAVAREINRSAIEQGASRYSAWHRVSPSFFERHIRRRHGDRDSLLLA